MAMAGSVLRQEDVAGSDAERLAEARLELKGGAQRNHVLTLRRTVSVEVGPAAGGLLVGDPSRPVETGVPSTTL
jgi:hypothetical protein